MASMWRRAMHYLGLGPDEEYDDYDLLGGSEPEPPAREPARRRPVMPAREPESNPNVRTLSSAARSTPPAPEPSPSRSSVASNGHAPRSGAERQQQPARGPNPARPAIVRPLAVPPSAKPHVVAPASFTDAQEVADQYKRNVPVIVNLQGVERDLMRRIIDFASGLCYGLGGQMERVANHVYLLTPNDVEVSDEDRRRLHERGYEA